MFLERPEGVDLEDAEGLDAVADASPLMTGDDIVPRLQDFATIGHLYRSIEAGFAHLAHKIGEERLFVGPPQAQITQANFAWPQLAPVTDLAGATAAIVAIVEQGEGPRGDWRDAHFGRFKRVLDEYLGMRAADPTFEPARPVLAARVRLGEGEAGGPLIGEPLTARAADLFNVAYEVLLQVLYRLLARIDESDAETPVLADVAVGLMYDAIEPRPDARDHAGGARTPRRDRGCAIRALLPTGLPPAPPPCGLAAVRRAARRGGVVCHPAVRGGRAHRRNINRPDRLRTATQVVRVALRRPRGTHRAAIRRRPAWRVCNRRRSDADTRTAVERP